MYYPFTEAALLAGLTLSNYFCAYINLDPFRLCKSNSGKIHQQWMILTEKHLLVAHFIWVVYGTVRNAQYRFLSLSSILAGGLLYLDVPVIFILGSVVGFFGVMIEAPQRRWKSSGHLDYRFVLGEYLVRYLSENNIDKEEATELFTAYLILTPKEYSRDEIGELYESFRVDMAEEEVETFEKGVERNLLRSLSHANWYKYLTWHNELYSLYEDLVSEDEDEV